MQAASALPGNKVQAALLHHICNHQHEHCKAAPQGEAVPVGVALHCGEQALACAQGPRLAPAVGQGSATRGRHQSSHVLQAWAPPRLAQGCLPDATKAGSRVQQRDAEMCHLEGQQDVLIWLRLMRRKPHENWPSSHNPHAAAIAYKMHNNVFPADSGF